MIFCIPHDVCQLFDEFNPKANKNHHQPKCWQTYSPQFWRAYVCHKITGMTDKELYQLDGHFKHKVRVGKKQIRCAYYCRACAFPPCGRCGKVLANALPIDEAQRKSKADEPSYRVVYPAKGSQKELKY